MSEAGIHPWIREGLGLGGSTPGRGRGEGACSAISTWCSQCRPHRRRLSRRRRCMRPHRSKAHSNCFISFRDSSLKEESTGVITSAARVQGLHSNRQQCTSFLRPITFHRAVRTGFWSLAGVTLHLFGPLHFPFFAISEPSEAAQCDESFQTLHLALCLQPKGLAFH